MTRGQGYVQSHYLLPSSTHAGVWGSGDENNGGKKLSSERVLQISLSLKRKYLPGCCTRQWYFVCHQKIK